MGFQPMDTGKMPVLRAATLMNAGGAVQFLAQAKADWLLLTWRVFFIAYRPEVSRKHTTVLLSGAFPTCVEGGAGGAGLGLLQE